MPEVPPAVDRVAHSWLMEIDELDPGLVDGLYLRGGLAFGEWVPGQSDIDFVATLSRRPTAHDLEHLGSAHAALASTGPEIAFDGMHVLADDLTRPPADCPDVPCSLGGVFRAAARSDLDPVTWHELARGGIPVRGVAVEDLGMWTDLPALLDFTRGNLDSYWRGNAEALAAAPAEGGPQDVCCWCVLGVARLHHLLVTEDLTTKSGAGRWGLSYYPERFHRVLREALRIREGGPDEYAGDAAARGADVTAFVGHVVEAGTA